MKILGVIPARFASSRFPGKPLADIGGKTMIARVYEQAVKCSKLTEVVVATDDERIATEVKRSGGKVILTSSSHQSGTDRCAEVAHNFPGFDALINIQGDEPFIDPAQIGLVAACFGNKDTRIATLVKEISDAADLHNNNIPKVVLNKQKQAIYFSRHTIPFIRGNKVNEWLSKHVFYKHIGIYGYRMDVLKEITKLPVSLLEEAEQLEQLRWLENGYSIQTAITTMETAAVDTPEDLETIKRKFLYL
ncbi:MAG: 3-deoxy-manno-octulosonate cytidylyltransferase [Pedobacter sp.]|nr:MAG: 3-deoxy-manno-octulosonate cytidylyltransferase [Pedobacter sp.]